TWRSPPAAPGARGRSAACGSSHRPNRCDAGPAPGPGPVQHPDDPWPGAVPGASRRAAAGVGCGACGSGCLYLQEEDQIRRADRTPSMARTLFSRSAMLILALARQVEICPTMFGTLLLATARRMVLAARGSTASG